jgi:peptide/nickel transport system permease protein
MIAHLSRRFLWAVFVLWAVITSTFFVNNVLPSDPARMVAGAQARPQDVARIRTQLGLDRPILEQYGIYVSRLVHIGPIMSGASKGATEHATCATLGPLHFDLGKSYQQRRAVVTILAERLPRTLLLAFAAVLVQILIGVSSGMIAARKRGTLVDRTAVAISLLGISAPTFVLGLVLQFVLAHKLRVLPLDGYGFSIADHLVSVILPALTLGFFGAAFYTRIVRDELISLLQQDYVRTSRAKGLSETAILFRHALRNALVPLVTIIGLELGGLVGGAIVTETLFRWPGIGALSVTALLDRDGPVILGTVLVTSAAVVFSSMVVDALYVALDPRVRK